jgi:hypothetical protein
MAIIHRTTLVPSKLDLLTPWLASQPWYRGTGAAPALARAGGFRLDDPGGAVGIEFAIVNDVSGDGPVSYLAPLAYRDAPCAEAAGGLLGTAEHGVLGTRWIYDGAHDPVLMAALAAFLHGAGPAQAQSESSTADPTVTCEPAPGRWGGAQGSAVTADGDDGTDVQVSAAGGAGLTVRLHRVLQPGGPAADAATRPHVAAGWLLPDGTEVRGVVASVR